MPEQNGKWIMSEGMSRWAGRTQSKALAVHRDRYVPVEGSGETHEEVPEQDLPEGEEQVNGATQI